MSEDNNSTKTNIFYYLWSLLPVLLGCFSVVIVFAAGNIRELILVYENLIHSFFLLVFVAIFLVLLLYIFIFRRLSFHVICNLVAILFWSLFTYAEINELAKSFGLIRLRYSLLLWIFFSFVITYLVFYFSKNRISTYFLSIFITGFFLTSIFQVGNFCFDYFYQNRNEVHSYKDIFLNSVASKPNVYYFILDQYNRNDVLNNVFHYNNDIFIGHLQKKKFFIAENSIANYRHTETSISSIFKMDYLYNPKTTNTKTNSHQGPQNLIYNINNSPVLKFFKKYNYNIIWVEGDDPITRCPGIENHCVTSYKYSFYTKFFSTTPFIILMYETQLKYPALNKLFNLLNVHDPRFLADKSLKMRHPFFLVANINAPHNFYQIYDDDCNGREHNMFRLVIP